MSKVPHIWNRNGGQWDGLLKLTLMQSSHVWCSSTRVQQLSFPNVESVILRVNCVRELMTRAEHNLTHVLWSNVHEALFDAIQLTPLAPSPRYHSTDRLSIIRVVNREEIVRSKFPSALGQPFSLQARRAQVWGSPATHHDFHRSSHLPSMQTELQFDANRPARIDIPSK